MKLIALLLICSSLTVIAQDVKPVYGNNPEAGAYAKVNGINLYYEVYGQGEPMLIIHGNGGSVFSAREQIPFFKDKYMVIVVDSRGHGKTNNNIDSLTYDMMADDINSLLEKIKIDSAYVFGQSDGAIVGLILAFRYPKKVKRLAAMAPNTRPDSAVFYPEVERRMEKNIASTRDSIRMGNQRAVEKLKLLRLMQYHPHISMKDLNNIKVPVLVMSGDRDMIRLSHIIEIFRGIPKSQLAVLPGSTHGALRQNASVFNDILYKFFSQPFKMPDTLDYFK